MHIYMHENALCQYTYIHFIYHVFFQKCLPFDHVKVK